MPDALSSGTRLDYTQPFSSVLPNVPKYAFDLLKKSTKATRARANAAALTLARKLHKTSSRPTPVERATLAQWSGQGGVDHDLNAYYTPTRLAASMWALVHQHGFTGGRVLEPSIGGGVFAETAPATAQMTGVEYNDDTAAVTSLLQPETKIHVMPFEQYQTTSDDEQYDLVIGNPPYGTRGQLRDTDKPEFGEYEQYFMDTALDRVKDGGLIAMVVPFGMMQNAGAREFRARMLARAELVTAVRTPLSTFEDSNSFVTPDVVLLRKRPTAIGGALAHLVGKHGEGVLKAAGVHREDVMSGHYFAIPEYDEAGKVVSFRDGYHPENALGKVIASGRWSQAAVDGELDDASLTQLATTRADATPTPAPQDWAQVRQALAAAGHDEAALNGAELRGQASQYPIREGTISQDGEYVMRDHRWHKIDTGALPMDEAKQLARDLERYRGDVAAGRTSLAEGSRADLAARVGAFMAQHAHLRPDLQKAADTRMPYLNHLLSSHDGERLSADLTEHQHNAGAVTEGVNLSDPHSVAAHLARRGSLTVDALAGMTGMGYDSARNLLMRSDDYAWDGGMWRDARSYYVGDVYDAQDAIAQLIENTPQRDLKLKLQAQAARFAAMKPPMSINDIDITPRARFVPVQVLEDYLNSKWNMRLNGRNLLKVSLVNGVYAAEVDVTGAGYSASHRVRDLNKSEVQSYMQFLNHKTQVDSVQGADDMTKAEYQAARKAAIDAAKAYEEHESQQFRTWLMASDAQDDVETAYNRQMNSYVQPDDNYDPLDLPQWTGPSLHPYQINAVRRMTDTGTGVVALDVGLGKTFAGLALAANLRATGKARKPLVVAPKSLLGNWVKNAQLTMPDARVLVVGMTEVNGKWTEDSSEEKRRKLTLAAAQDWDLIIMSRDTFTDIPMRRERRLELIESDYQAQRTMGMRGRQAFEKNKPPTERQSEQQKQEFFEKQLRKVSSAGPTDIAFEDLGFDAVIRDEGHDVKNLYAAPSVFGQDPKFMGGGAESNRAMDFHHKMRHVRSVNGGRGSYVFTATPTKNSPLEIYNMLALVSDSLQTHGLPGVDDFVDRYCDIQGTVVPTKDGSVTALPAVVGFKNLPELRGIMDRYLIREDAKTALTKDGIGLKMPERVDIEQAFDLSPEARRDYDYLRERANNVKQGDTGEDHLFAIMAKMRKLTMDPALYDPSYADVPNPRFEKAAEIAAAGLAGGGKIVAFMDIGQTGVDDDGEGEGGKKKKKKTGPDSYDRLVDHFVRAGIPRDQIAVVTADTAKTAAARSKVEDDFQSGKIRVVIGNTPTIGEGFNLQNGTTDMIHLDTPWDPGTYWQRLGRAERQGNPVDQVRNHVLLARGSFDGVTYSTMRGKKGWQQQVWDRSVSSATNNVGMDMEEIALALSENPEKTREQIRGARENLNKGALAAGTKMAMKKFGSYVDARDAWLRRKREANGRKDGPTENDDRIIEKLERTLKDARSALKDDLYFSPYAKLLDYPGTFRFTPAGVPLHEGMKFTIKQKGADGTEKEIPGEVRETQRYDGKMFISLGEGDGQRGMWVKPDDLPTFESWSPSGNDLHYYGGGAHPRPNFAKASVKGRPLDSNMYPRLQFGTGAVFTLPPIPEVTK